MNNFFSCVHKDIKIFGRSKFSAIVAVLIPLVIVLLIGAAFSSSELSGVKVSVYSGAYNELTESIISNFEAQSFVVIKEDSSEKCIGAVISDRSQICVVFPSELSSEGNVDAVEFHVDNSQVNLAYVLVEEVRQSVASKSSEISVDLVNDLVDALNSVKSSLETEKANLDKAAQGARSLGTSADSARNSIPDLSSVVTKLESAKNIADDINSSSLSSQINSALAEVTTASESFDSFSTSLGDMKTNSATISAELSTVSSAVDGAIVELKGIKVTEAEKIVSPIRTEIKNVVAESTNWDFIFPTILALMVLFGSTLLAAVMALRDKQSRAYFRNFITPTSEFTFLVAMYVSSIIILIIQTLVLFAGLILITNLAVSNIATLALVLFVSATTFIFLGLFVGHLFRSEQVAILVSLSVISLMLFFSNVILPVESILGKFQSIATYNPLVVTSSMLKKVLLFDQGISQMMPEFYILLIALVVCFGLAYAAKRSTRRFV
jgi:ABC-type multidrug transport system permease subunit